MANSQTAYTKTAITLHWLIFALIACGYTLGQYMADLPLSPMKLKYFSWHRWLGVTVFILALARVAWRATHPAPLPLPGEPKWQRTLANAGHTMLYILIITIPLSGWLHSSAAGVQTIYLDLIPLPNLLGKDKPLAKFFEEIHSILNDGLAVLVVIHTAAALKHHFVDRDVILKRMLPFLKLR